MIEQYITGAVVAMLSMTAVIVVGWIISVIVSARREHRILRRYWEEQDVAMRRARGKGEGMTSDGDELLLA